MITVNLPTVHPPAREYTVDELVRKYSTPYGVITPTNVLWIVYPETNIMICPTDGTYYFFGSSAKLRVSYFCDVKITGHNAKGNMLCPMTKDSKS